MSRRLLLPLILLAIVACDGDDEDQGHEWYLAEYDGEEMPVVLATVAAGDIPMLPPCEAELADEVLVRLFLDLEPSGVLDVTGAMDLVYHCASGEDETVALDLLDGEGTWAESGGELTLTVPDDIAASIGLIESWTGTYSEDGDELIVEASDFQELVILRFAQLPGFAVVSPSP